MNLLSRLDRWLWETHAMRTVDLAVYRIVYASVALLLMNPAYSWLESAPAFLFRPPLSLAAAYGTAPHWLLEVSRIALAASLGLLLVGCWTRFASLAVALSFIGIQSFAFAYGKVDHVLLYAIVPLCLAWSSWGEKLSVDAMRGTSREYSGLPMSILALLVATAMFTAGWAKAATGWLALDTNAVLYHLYPFVETGRLTFIGESAISYTPPLLWELNDWVCVIFELSGVVAMLGRRSLRIWLACACFFHLGVLFIYTIPFPSNVLAYGAFFPWARIAGAPNRVLRTRSAAVAVSMSVMWCILSPLTVDEWLGGLPSATIVIAPVLLLALLFYGHRSGTPSNPISATPAKHAWPFGRGLTEDTKSASQNDNTDSAGQSFG